MARRINKRWEDGPPLPHGVVCRFTWKQFLLLLAVCLPGAWLYTSCEDPRRRHPVWGVDVSHHQGDIDWTRVRAAGAAFARQMLAPGDAYLEFRIRDLADGSSELRMIPSFRPRGRWGRLYWWLIAPSHALVFPAMLRQMAKAARARIVGGPYRIPAG